MLNKSIVTGRLTKDPVIRTTEGENRCASFTLAVERNYRDKNGEKSADFIQIAAWNVLADVCEKHLHKGDLCTVEGSIRTGSFTRDGIKVYTTDVRADTVYLLPQLPRDSSSGSSDGTVPDGFEEIAEELPF